MNKDDAIEQLTAQLRDVTLRLAQLEAAAGRENNESSAETAAAPSSLLRTTVASPIIQKGDRVNIINTVNKPRNWNNNLKWDQQKAQKATITHFYRGQIHFITDNGVRTWRAVNNLTKEE
jgi:hypothetical protein